MDIGSVLGAGLILFVLFIYFIPTINAVSRKHHQRDTIFIINLFLGWTFLGWVVALAWSASAIPAEHRSTPKVAPIPEPEQEVFVKPVRKPNAFDRWGEEKLRRLRGK